MSDIDHNDYVGQFEFVRFDDNIPEGDFVRFVVLFINKLLKTFENRKWNFSFHLNLEEKVMHYIKMASLVYYSFSRGFTKASIIADMAKNHTYFKYAANGITPNEDTINNFINI